MKQIFAWLFVLACASTHSLIAQIGTDPQTGNASIDFYGKVVDQDGNPLAGAKVSIELHVGYWPAPEGSDLKQEKMALMTDINGNFVLMQSQGHSLTVESIDKPGYELSQKIERMYSYSAAADIFHPDPKNPIIFKMWKKGVVESLIVGSKFYGINPDGQPSTIDFVQQKKKNGINLPGDIIVRVERPATIQPRTKYDWSYSIEAVDGGVISTADEFLYRAPMTGYQPKYEFTMSATNANWHSEVKNQQFYFKSRNGQVYGAFVVEIIPYYNDKSVFNVQYSVNSSGSRNLER